jgi:hypothetical protein
MAKYRIKNAEGNVLNTIVANLEFVESNYEFYEEVSVDPAKSLEDLERRWRNKELNDTDKYMMISDYPESNKAIMADYRKRLRDWPSTESFPETRPELIPEVTPETVV